MEPRADQLKTVKPGRRRAVALILVLAFVVLIAATIIGFFASATSARRESAGYESGIAVKQLADVVTNVVMGQIADGTRSWEIPPEKPADKGSGARLTYSTQPGLIRTYTDAGSLGRIFKLYSSDAMVTQPASAWSVTSQLGNEVPANWPGQPAHFADLNQPVLFDDPAGLIVRTGSTRKYSAAFPILNPLALLPVTGATAGVEGFDLRGIPGYVGGAGQPAISVSGDPTADAPSGTTSNPAPMPVRWIYLLRDGTLTTPAANGANTLAADWSGLPDGSTLKPTKDNPITGRIAFWTDDETCKLNVNTSGEPTPWDTPRAVTIQDLRYGQFQPAQQEYQRFPGHPFTTALSPVLFPGVKLSAAQKEDIYKIIPRLGTGGTLAASRAIPPGTAANNLTYQITLDSDRLYANMDEFLFAPPTAAGARPENPNVTGTTLPKFKEQLKRSRFFLTANSRSPEVTLFGTPRISLWPVHTSTALRTTFDTLAAFCTSVGPDSTAKPSMPFYFQRQDSTSPKADYDNIPRNKELYKYLQTLTSTGIPGYGGNFKQKWGDDRDQVLTEIFDYIRCVNLRDPVLVTQGKTRYADNGQVAPIQIGTPVGTPVGTTQGFGRYHTISQFGFHFICAQDGKDGAADAKNPALKDGERAIETSFLFSPFSPSLGFYKIAEDLEYDVTFKGTFTIDGQDLKMASGKTTLNNKIGNGWHNNGREHGGPGGLRGPVQALGGGGYKYVSKAEPRVKVKAGATTMNFSGGSIEVKVWIKTNLIQTFTLDFPGGNFPVPKFVKTGTDAYRGGSSTTKDYWWTFAKRYSNAGQVPHAPGTEYANTARRWADSSGAPGFKIGGLFREEDVVRSIVPDHGDLRFIAAKSQISAAEFVKVSASDWESKYRFLHVFVSSAGSQFFYGFANEPGASPSTDPEGIPGAGATDQLVPNSAMSYHYSRLPEIRPGAGLKYNKWGDFDNGVANWPDGAYINKPDEGNQASTNSPYTYFAWNFTAASDTFFSPSRLVPSAGMLGSLPTGIKRHSTANPHAWETLLFRPQSGHPGESFTPKDHLIMDLFWMPIGEPYPISEPFSTAGKINLNYEIAPFSYIRRTTALRGAMKAEEPLILINSGSKIYKLWDHDTNDHPRQPSDSLNKDTQVRTDWTKAYNGQTPFDQLRRPIDVEKTLAQADTRFASGKAFRSATEICELHLVRTGEKLSDYQDGTIFSGALPTGDNVRERPYANLYAKLTTKSNTFNVHMRVQVLRKRGGTAVDQAVWNEDLDTVVAEHRGSALIERYVDASDPNLPDFATNTNATLDNYARFRILSTNKFAP